MTVLPRSEVKRMRAAALLGIVMAVTILVAVASASFEGSGLRRAGLLLLILLAATTIVISAIQWLSNRNPSQAIIFREGDQTIVAINRLHEGFKLRFLREVLGEYMVAFTDEERERWKALEQVGFHPVFNFQNARKTLVLPLCFMVFEQVYVMDHTNRWDYFDCRNTSEPAFSERGIGPFTDDSIVHAIRNVDRQTT